MILWIVDNHNAARGETKTNQLNLASCFPDPFTREDAEQQVAELAARQRLVDERGEAFVLGALAQSKILSRTERDHGDIRPFRVELPVDRKCVAAAQIEIEEDEVGWRIHRAHLFRNVRAGRVSLEMNAEVAQDR